MQVLLRFKQYVS